MQPFGSQPVTPALVVHHAPGAPGLRWLGMRPNRSPSRALLKLQLLFDRHAPWATGRRVPEELLHTPLVAGVERVYLMTTNSAGFYRQLGFLDADLQQLLVLKH